MMIRRMLAVGLLAALTVLGAAPPARAHHDTAHTIAQMTAHYRDPALEFQNRLERRGGLAERLGRRLVPGPGYDAGGEVACFVADMRP